MSNRIPVERWNRPRSEVLEEHNYKSGQPPFDPFPTVTNVLDAALCPVALLHHILHGNDSALIPVQESFGFGKLFQDFIGFLKPALSDGRIPNDISRIRYEFDLFARSFSAADAQKCWRFYLERWCGRKQDELAKLKPNSNFFEVSVANSHIPFRLENTATRTYPLRGRIDEIDIENRKLIERTIKGMPAEDHPPRLKDYQVWLLWKTLSSVPKAKLPIFWANVDFQNFSLLVETPYHDFEVAKENTAFEERTHNAYSWIQDLAKGGRSEWEAYNDRACTYLHKMEDCGCLRMCYGRRRPFPTTRTEMRREFRNIYRPLCWQEMWDHDLLQYQLLDLVPDALQSLGYVSIGKIVSFQGREIELELDKKQAQPVIDQLIAGESNSYLIVVGTFHVGFELDASFVKVANDKFVMETTHRKLPETGVALILPSDSSVVKQRPWFLSRNIQRDVFSLESWGLEIPERAAKQSVIQFMESLFGVKPLRSERNAGQ